MTKNEDVLKGQTFVLKVYIHCEGCKKKVKKVLNTIEGVYTMTIDAAEQKVTVTGNVASADVLVKRLLKSGKHAEVWPQPQKSGNSSGKQQQNEQKALPQPPQKEKKPAKDDSGSDGGGGKEKGSENSGGNEGKKKKKGGGGGGGEGAKKGEDAENSGGAAVEGSKGECSHEGSGGGGGGGGGGGKKKKKGGGGGGGGAGASVGDPLSGEPSFEADESAAGFVPMPGAFHHMPSAGFGPMPGAAGFGHVPGAGFGHMGAGGGEWIGHAHGMPVMNRPVMQTAYYSQYAPPYPAVYTQQPIYAQHTSNTAAYEATHFFDDENTSSCSVM